MSAKEIVLRPVAAAVANALVRRVHYSGKVATNAQLHIGVYWRGVLEGALQFGPGIDHRRTLGLVRETRWDGMLELSRMAFTEALPRNSESRALAIALRLLRQHAPQVEWILSYADGTQCGDGTIYRAAGFLLTGIKKNTEILRVGHTIVAGKTLNDYRGPRGGVLGAHLRRTGEAQPLPGFQLRYIAFLNPAARARLAVPVLPYAAIAAAGAGMYRGQRVSERGAGGGTAVVPAAGDGSIPIRSLSNRPAPVAGTDAAKG